MSIGPWGRLRQYQTRIETWAWARLRAIDIESMSSSSAALVVEVAVVVVFFRRILPPRAAARGVGGAR